jgi:ADP-heptose:LPS heptosyltransferase
MDGVEQVLHLPEKFKVNTFGDDFDESHGRFMDSAALIENLDLVISVDTSIIHLAGGLGKPIWTLLPYSPDCRWDLNDYTTPWYKTMRLFRQPARNDWNSVVDRLKKELKAFVETKRKSSTTA